eukprot:scaffold14337_cov132-Isochrysis_galbana.AAC.4
MPPAPSRRIDQALPTRFTLRICASTPWPSGHASHGPACTAAQSPARVGRLSGESGQGLLWKCTSTSRQAGVDLAPSCRWTVGPWRLSVRATTERSGCPGRSTQMHSHYSGRFWSRTSPAPGASQMR